MNESQRTLLVRALIVIASCGAAIVLIVCLREAVVPTTLGPKGCTLSEAIDGYCTHWSSNAVWPFWTAAVALGWAIWLRRARK